MLHVVHYLTTLELGVQEKDHTCCVRLSGCYLRCCAAADVTRRGDPKNKIKFPYIYPIRPTKIPLDFIIRA